MNELQLFTTTTQHRSLPSLNAQPPNIRKFANTVKRRNYASQARAG